jgi:hypothetical protein
MHCPHLREKQKKRREEKRSDETRRDERERKQQKQYRNRYHMEDYTCEDVNMGSTTKEVTHASVQQQIHIHQVENTRTQSGDRDICIHTGNTYTADETHSFPHGHTQPDIHAHIHTHKTVI